MTQPERRTRARLVGLVLTSAFGAVVAIALGAFGAQFVQDPFPLFITLGLAWLALTGGRALWYLDVPRGLGGVPAEISLGVALGLVGMGVLNAFLVEGPVFAALAAGLGFGLHRAHAPLMAANRAKGAAPRLIGGILDPRELGALALLVVGYAMLGFGAHRVFVALSGLVPDAQKAVSIGIALYVLYGVKLLLKFAAHDAAPVEGGFVAWFKANLLRNAIIALVLVAYAVYRNDLAGTVPYFPLVEFGLGLAVFGAMLARLRWRLKRERTDHAAASDARPHVQRVDPLTEGEYEAVARPVTRFLETGRGVREYETVVRETARLDTPEASEALDPVRRYRSPPEEPPLPLSFALVASIVAGLGFGVAAGVLLYEISASATADVPREILGYAIDVALIVLGLAIYRVQDVARSHRRPGAAAGVAMAGSALVLVGAARLVQPIGDALLVWVAYGVGALLLLGVPLLTSWRLARRIESDAAESLPPEPPSAVLERGLQAARRLAATAALGAVVLLVLVPFVLGWLVQVARMPEGVSTTYDSMASAALWALAATGGGALVRYFGYSKARPHVLAQERQRRDERIQLHSEIMRRLAERV